MFIKQEDFKSLFFDLQQSYWIIKCTKIFNKIYSGKILTQSHLWKIFTRKCIIPIFKCTKQIQNKRTGKKVVNAVRCTLQFQIIVSSRFEPFPFGFVMISFFVWNQIMSLYLCLWGADIEIWKKRSLDFCKRTKTSNLDALYIVFQLIYSLNHEENLPL